MEDKFHAQRLIMVAEQIEARGISDERVLKAMRDIPRHLFMPPDTWQFAYDDSPVPIGRGQTISQPYIVAFMTAALDVQRKHKVLEIGTGSGYQAAVLSRLCDRLDSIETIPELAHQAEKNLRTAGIENVTVHTGDGNLGLPHLAPFDRIIITAAAARTPQRLLEQLVEGGLCVAPVGPPTFQWLKRFCRKGHTWQEEDLLPVSFVPLVGS